MPRWWFVLFTVLLLPACGAPSRAEDSGWTAWLRFGRTLVLVDSDGNTRREIELPLADKFQWDEGEGAVTFSPDGERVSYQLQGLDSQPQTFVYSLRNGAFWPDMAEVSVSDTTEDSFTPTGEKVIPQAGILFVYDSIRHARYPFFAGAESSKPHFVQNGECILSLVDPADGSAEWLLIERDGSLSGERSTGIQVHSLEGTPDGFIYTADLTAGGITVAAMPALLEVNTRTSLSNERVVWLPDVDQIAAIMRYGLHIEWVGYDAPLGPYKPWSELAAPVYDPPAENTTLQPTMIPPPTPVFHVGMLVKVQTIDGEILYLRAEPNRQAEILLHIEDDTRLLLVGGPHTAEGLTWWRVQMPDGVEGWAVENTGDLQTLFPAAE